MVVVAAAVGLVGVAAVVMVGVVVEEDTEATPPHFSGHLDFEDHTEGVVFEDAGLPMEGTVEQKFIVLGIVYFMHDYNIVFYHTW